MCIDQMAKFIDHTAMFIDLTCIFRAGFWAGHPVRNARWGRSGPVGVGRGRSGTGTPGGVLGTCVIPDRQGPSEASDVRSI